MVGDLLAERRRAVVLWVGDRERAGENIVVRDVYAALARPQGLFPEHEVLQSVILDLERTGHLLMQIDLGGGLAHAYALTERGREWYAQLRASPLRRLGGWIGRQSLTILVAAVTAAATTIAARLVERWLFPP